MNATILRLTARQLFGQKRTGLVVLLVAIPIVFAMLYRWGNSSTEPQDWVANTLFVQVIVGALLPFVALIFGTAALGTEFEDGTAVYLLAKPIPRWEIIASKLFIAWVATSLFVIVASLASAPIALAGSGGGGMVTAFVVASVLAAFAYCALFIAMSVVTSHALIVGLLYVFIWEGVLTNLFGGLRLLSVREYTESVAHGLGGISNTILKVHLGGLEAFLLLIAISAISCYLAVRWLSRWQIGETG